MATRGYFPSTGAAPISPNVDSDWENTSLLARLKGVTTRISSAMTTVEFLNDTGQNLDIICRQYVFGPFNAATISGTIKIQMRGQEGDAANNMFMAWGARVIGPDLTVRGELVSVRRDGTEWTTSLVNRGDSVVPTSVALLAGDYVVVEIGGGGDATGITGGGAFGKGNDFRVRIGDATATDLAEDNTDTGDDNPWIEFTETLVAFAPGFVPRVIVPNRWVGPQVLRRSWRQPWLPTRAAAGTEYTQSLAGTTGALSGALAKVTLKAASGATGVVTGTIAKLTSRALNGATGAVTGAITKLTSRSLTGTTGVPSGALTTSKLQFIALAGATGALTGTLAKQTNKALAGATGTLSGSISKLTSRSLAGTMGALSGAVTSTRIYFLSLSGAAGALTGTLSKLTARTLNGATGAVSGTVAKTMLKALSGATGTLTGAVTSTRIYFLSLAGTLGALSGSIAKTTARSLAGSTGSLTGSLAKLTTRSLSGTMGVLSGALGIFRPDHRPGRGTARLAGPPTRGSGFMSTLGKGTGRLAGPPTRGSTISGILP